MFLLVSLLLLYFVLALFYIFFCTLRVYSTINRFELIELKSTKNNIVMCNKFGSLYLYYKNSGQKQ